MTDALNAMLPPCSKLDLKASLVVCGSDVGRAHEWRGEVRYVVCSLRIVVSWGLEIGDAVVTRRPSSLIVV